MLALDAITPGDLRAGLQAWGFKPAHAAPLLRAYYATGGELDWNRLPRFPEALRARILTEGIAAAGQVADRQISGDGAAKLLLRLSDGRTVESVLMPDHQRDRAAGCLSSQVGCAMGCDFCATTRSGFERNLTAAEIVAQFLALRREALASGRRLHTVVFMGMGEPMHNLEAVLEAIPRIADNAYGGLGWRQVTVATVGIVAGIDALREADLNVNLAVSLHAPDDATRERILPPGRRHRIADVLAAADRFQASTGHPVSVQYCLLKGVNDSQAQAGRLAELLGARRMHVNLLRYNPTGPSLSGVAYEAADEAAAEAFANLLRARGLVVHFRRPRGRDIDAACGQLRERHRTATGFRKIEPGS